MSSSQRAGTVVGRTSPRKPSPKAGVVNIHCPTCGVIMRLRTIMPEETDGRERMTFDCDCGYTLQQSHLVASERGL